MNYASLFLSLLLPLTANAVDTGHPLVIKDPRFQPAELTVPANKKITLRIENNNGMAQGTLIAR